MKNINIIILMILFIVFGFVLKERLQESEISTLKGLKRVYNNTSIPVTLVCTEVKSFKEFYTNR